MSPSCVPVEDTYIFYLPSVYFGDQKMLQGLMVPLSSMLLLLPSLLLGRALILYAENRDKLSLWSCGDDLVKDKQCNGGSCCCV